MTFDKKKAAQKWAKMETIRTGVKHIAVRTIQHKADLSMVMCYTVILQGKSKWKNLFTLND